MTNSLPIFSSLKTALLRYPSHFSSHSLKLPSLWQMSEQRLHSSTKESQYSVAAAHSPSQDAAVAVTAEGAKVEAAAATADEMDLLNMAAMKWSDVRSDA